MYENVSWFKYSSPMILRIWECDAMAMDDKQTYIF